MDSNNIDDRYKIRSFTDCKGTCKTPIGCTCREDDEENNKGTEQIKPAVQIPVNAEGLNVADNKISGCSCKKKKGSCCGGCNKLEVYDWLSDIPQAQQETQMVEVQFKNTRKGYYLNSNNIELYKGDIVAVEATPGHDIGEVTLTGKLVTLQMKKNNFRGEIKRVYRIAKPNDIERAEEARAKEHKTMLRAREIAEELNLNMKISDVEYQGDGNKAIYYYIADERVDFRQLIKVYASEFRVKIEMKQIGARQEAGRVGGIGPCGRELCCSGYMGNFVSVSTSAARLQDISLNPQKLAGQCGKLKCCLNFETDTYVEAQRQLPQKDIVLETRDSSYYHFKTDILSGMMTYSTSKDFAANLIILPKDRVFDIIKMNRRGQKPDALESDEKAVKEKPVSHDLLDQESISRFDSSDKNRRNDRSNRNKRNKNQRNNSSEENNNRLERTDNSARNERPNKEQRQLKPNKSINLQRDHQQNNNQDRSNNNSDNRRNNNDSTMTANENRQGNDGQNRRPNHRNRNNKNRPNRPRNDERSDAPENNNA